MEKMQFGLIAMLVQWFWQQHSCCHAQQSETASRGSGGSSCCCHIGHCNSNLEQTSDKGNQLTATSSW